MTDTLVALRKKAMALPMVPGVYLMKDSGGKIIYVGKAKVLKNRVSQYFGAPTGHSPKVRRMVEQVATFDYIVAGSEFEALVLECSLIKQYQPKYNILLKDDKGYCYLRISPPPFSRITEAKQQANDGARYVGPFMSSFAVKQAVDEVNKLFLLSTCRKPLGKRTGERPCLNHYIGQCCAPCTGRVSAAEYAERVEQAVQYLTEGSGKLIATLTARMNDAAERLDFETAARLRDRIRAVSRIKEKQNVVRSTVKRQDIIALSQMQTAACFEVFRFVGGALADREHFYVEPDDDAPALRAEFLRRFYSLREDIPPRIVLDGAVEDEALLSEWLTQTAAARYAVKFVFPQKGEQAALLKLCAENAAERVAARLETGGKEIAALAELQTLLGLSAPPARIESYDISHTAGRDAVAGMVVFEKGKPRRADYRRFAIREATAGDDPAAMKEVLSRRMAEYEAHKGESGFGTLPDLILLDGGQWQVAAVRAVMTEAGYTVPVFGMVKDSHHRTRAIAENGGEIAVSSKRAAFTLLGTIQEEVHRFAIGYHRQKRRKIGTTLTEIPGVGEKRAALLLRHFGSVAAVKAATVDQLAAVKGMTRPAAEAIVKHFEDS